MSYYVRPDFNLKTLNPYDIYQAIEQCNSKILKITYCSLRIDGQCMNTKTNVIQIKRLYKTCDFIEGTILKDDKPYEDIVLKADQILKVECIKSNKPDNKPEEKRSSLDDLLNDSDFDKDDNMLEDYIMNNNKENEETKDEDLTQSDLFNLIDSMYEKGEDK